MGTFFGAYHTFSADNCQTVNGSSIQIEPTQVFTIYLIMEYAALYSLFQEEWQPLAIHIITRQKYKEIKMFWLKQIVVLL
jgi:hypothetical protein